ncbi:MAG: hypothetical protein KDA91_23910, partial [Planctomycetaceae bacterium]|nr:hypothetical protein [Planctomycetaceae bacterium]
IDGWPVHVLSGIFGDTTATENGVTWPNDIQLCATDTAVHWHFCQPDTRSVLTEIIKHDFEEPEAAGLLRKKLLYLKGDCKLAVRRFFWDDDYNSVFPDETTGVGRHTGRGDYTIAADIAPQELVLTATFEADAAAFGILWHSLIILEPLEALDF